MSETVKLNWIKRKVYGAGPDNYIVWTCVQAGIIKIVKYEKSKKYILSGRKYEMPFNKFTMAKQVANLIYNG